MNFSKLGIADYLIKSLEENDIQEPTEIQEKVIPLILKNSTDLVGIAQTGTGKTASFALPILQKIDTSENKIQCLVLTPTRELAQQVKKEFFVLSRYTNRVFSEVVFGGKPIDEQVKKLQRPTHVLVATPGRLLDLIDKKAVNLDNLKYLILDEADEMLNMGFKKTIDEIIEYCPDQAQRLLFSATLPRGIQNMISEYLSPKCHEIRVKQNEKTNKNINHKVINYQFGHKIDYLKAYLLANKEHQGMVFCRTKAAATLLGQQLAGFEVKAAALHGDLQQFDRDKIMRGLKSKRINTLICTDIAARGIDIPNLGYVIHYHLPEKEEQYTHRSGRTARAGKTGDSVIFCIPEDELDSLAIEDALQIRFEEEKLNVFIEKKEKEDVEMYINIGAIHGFNNDELSDFLNLETGVKTDYIDVTDVRSDYSTFLVEKRYQDQIIFNIKGKKRFHTNLKISLDIDDTSSFIRKKRK